MSRTWGINVRNEPPIFLAMTTRAGHGYQVGDIIEHNGPLLPLWRRIWNRIVCKPDHPRYVVRGITPTTMHLELWREDPDEVSFRLSSRAIALIGLVMMSFLLMGLLGCGGGDEPLVNTEQMLDDSADVVAPITLPDRWPTTVTITFAAVGGTAPQEIVIKIGFAGDAYEFQRMIVNPGDNRLVTLQHTFTGGETANRPVVAYFGAQYVGVDRFGATLHNINVRAE